MSERVINRYCRQVKRLLLGPADTRRELVRGLRAELRELPVAFTGSSAALAANYGSVPCTAEELQAVISPEERILAIQRRRIRRRAVGAAAGILILTLALAVLFLRYMPVYSGTYPHLDAAGALSGIR